MKISFVNQALSLLNLFCEYNNPYPEQLTCRRLEVETLLSGRIIEITDISFIKTHLMDLKALLAEGEIYERKAFIKSFLKNILVKNNEVELTYTMPLLSNGIIN